MTSKESHMNRNLSLKNTYKLFLIYNDIKRKSREQGLIHSNAYRSFLKFKSGFTLVP